MSQNKTKPTDQKVPQFLSQLTESRQQESEILLNLMSQISGQKALMWGPSIIGFGSKHYKYESGREGDIPQLAFSPRKAAITIYFNEGFGDYGPELKVLGKHKISLSCLYINKLTDINLAILKEMLQKSFKLNSGANLKPSSVQGYISSVPTQTKLKFNQLRQLAQKQLPNAEEVLSYGIIGYKIDGKRPRVFISGFKDHVAIYPQPKEADLRAKLKPYIRGKGTLWFPLDQPLPESLISEVITSLAKA